MSGFDGVHECYELPVGGDGDQYRGVKFLIILAALASCRKGEAQMENRALIVVTSNDTFGPRGSKEKRTGWYLSEVTHVYYPLLAGGYEVDFASPRGGKAPMDESSRRLDDDE